MFFYSYGDHQDLHSFPTRRSSDLSLPARGRGHCDDRCFNGQRSRRSFRGAHLTRLRRPLPAADGDGKRSEEHTSELQSHSDLVCRLLLEKKKRKSYSRVTSTVRRC